MEEARQEPDFAAYFPEHIPEDFQPEEAWLDMGQGRYSLRLCWSRGSNTISVCINRMAEVPASQFADLQEPASYDLRLYPIPRGDSIPDLYWDSIQDPVFRAEDVPGATGSPCRPHPGGRKPTSSSRFFTQTAYWCNTAWMSVLPSYGPW